MHLLIAAQLVLISIIDLKSHLIHNRSLAVLALLLSCADDFQLRNFVIGTLFILPLCALTRCGGGDTKLLLVLAGFVAPNNLHGEQLWIFTVIISVQLLFALWRKRSHIALAPALCIPVAVSYLVL